MPKTHDAINACGAKIRVADIDGSMLEISGDANSSNLKFERQIGEYATFGEGYMLRLECKKDAKLDMTIVYTINRDGAMALLNKWNVIGGERRIEIELVNDMWVGFFFIKDFDIPLKSDEAKPVMVKMNFLPNGLVDYINKRG
jgi:hypothetical protein